MSSFVESLKRLYESDKSQVSEAHILGLLEKGKITKEESEYILSKQFENEYKQAYEIVTGVQA